MLSVIQVKSSYHLYLCQVATVRDLSPPHHLCDTAQMLWKQDERCSPPAHCSLLRYLSN